MSLWELTKYFAVGIGLNIVLFIVIRAVGGEILQTIYWPWITGGELLFPSGPGGHAMPGGAMLGILVGFLVYSLLLGLGWRRFWMWRRGE